MMLSTKQSLLQISFLLISTVCQTTAIQFTNSNFSVQAGRAFNVTWSGQNGLVDVILGSGTTSNFTKINVIAGGVAFASAVWTPYATTPASEYILRLDDASGQPAFSSPFTMLSAGAKAANTGLQFTNPTFEGIIIGIPFNLTWAGATGTTGLTLQNGSASTMNKVESLTSGMTDPTVNWVPAASLMPSQYILQVTDTSGQFAYSDLFNLLAAGSKPEVVTTTVPSSPSSTSTTMSDTTDSPPSSPDSASNEISPQTKIAIGVGVGLGVSAIAICSAFLILYTLRRRKAQADTASNGSSRDSFSQAAPPPAVVPEPKTSDGPQRPVPPPVFPGVQPAVPVELHVEKDRPASELAAPHEGSVTHELPVLGPNTPQWR